MDVQDYELVRNRTILFFLEKLIDKGEARTLHDLSCQFGTKGFSKEMRQIAGGSKAGLRRFLQQYPSLFVIENENVSVASIKQLQNVSSSNQQDYGFQARDYFKSKLREYGEGIVVPLKCLLGHRSQAPPEVRHVSGQHAKEFKDFLLKFKTDFVVTPEENVFLKEFEDSVTEGNFEKDDTENCYIKPSKSDDQFIATVLHFIKIEVNEYHPKNAKDVLDSLFRKFNSVEDQLPFRTEQDFKTFLRLYSDTFILNGDFVSLTSTNTSRKPSKGKERERNSDLASNLSQYSLRDRVGSVLRDTIAKNEGKIRSEKKTKDTNDVSNATNSCYIMIFFKLFLQDSCLVLTSLKEAEDKLNQMRCDLPVVGLSVKGSNIGPDGKITSIHIGSSNECVVFDAMALPDSFFKSKPFTFTNQSYYWRQCNFSTI